MIELGKKYRTLDGREVRIYAVTSEGSYLIRGAIKNGCFVGWSEIEDNVMPEPNSGCWLWTGRLDIGGYGIVSMGRRSAYLQAHRFSWETHNGPVPDDLYVLHKCDVRCCINPDHLFLGTYADNNRDMTAKGRHWRASKSTCPDGHEYGPFDGRQRRCLICDRRNKKASYLRRKAARQFKAEEDAQS